jgi:hypothetical protein
VIATGVMPAMNGRAFAMAACTAGSFSDASWLSLLSHASLIQIAFGSVGSVVRHS